MHWGLLGTVFLSPSPPEATVTGCVGMCGIEGAVSHLVTSLRRKASVRAGVTDFGDV